MILDFLFLIIIEMLSTASQRVFRPLVFVVVKEKWKQVKLNYSCKTFLFILQQCGSALLSETGGITESVTMTVAGSNSMAMTGRPKGVYVPSQTSLLPKVQTHIMIGVTGT